MQRVSNEQGLKYIKQASISKVRINVTVEMSKPFFIFFYFSILVGNITVLYVCMVVWFDMRLIQTYSL